MKDQNVKSKLSEERLTRETVQGPRTWPKTEVEDKRREGHESKKVTKGAHHE